MIILLSLKAERQLLTNLLNDPALRPAITAHIHALLPKEYPTYLASVRERVEDATEPLRMPEDRLQKREISIGDRADACAPFLHDVVRIARMPFPEVTRDAFAFLREIHRYSLPDCENWPKDREARTRFDKAVDHLLAGLLERLPEGGDKEALDETDGRWLEDLNDDLMKDC